MSLVKPAECRLLTRAAQKHPGAATVRERSGGPVDRRNFLQAAAAGMLLWASPRALRAQTAAGPIRGNVSVVDAGGTNLLAFAASDGVVLVDSGPPASGGQVMSALKTLASGAGLRTLFNTHYHLDQTGNNERFGAAGAAIVAHVRTRQWMSTEYWVPEEDRYQKARPKAAWPTQVFETTGSLKAGGEQVDYGYLTLAHTSGDIYVHFKNANVMAVGDVASPLRDPAFDWFTGAWIGGRVDSMDTILKLADDQTKIVPAYGPVMTKAEFKAERDMMETVRDRLFKTVRQGDGPKDMLADGVLSGLPRSWKDPQKFLYDAAKGLWAHQDKIGPNVV